MLCDFNVTLQDAAKLKHGKDKTPYAYILKFADASWYIGSASGMYRLSYYRSVARGTYPSLKKNPLLISALLTLPCTVDIIWCSSLDEARLREKALWINAQAQGTKLRNCREFGHSGRWIQQDPETHAKRIAALKANGLQGSLNAKKLADGRSRGAVKGVLSRALNKGQELKLLKNLDPVLITELMSELKGK